MMVGRLLGFETGKLMSQAGAEIILEPDLAEKEAIVRYIERRIIILYSGAMAEALTGKEIDGDFAKRLLDFAEASNDFAKIRVCTHKIEARERGLAHVRYPALCGLKPDIPKGPKRADVVAKVFLGTLNRNS